MPQPLVGRASELARLEELVAIVRGGASASLVLRGEPGIGKTALLEWLAASTPGVRLVRALGVEGEVDLPYAGLQQLCRPVLESVVDLPAPQAHALRVAFGLEDGGAPDRYMVGLATLGLLSEAAATQPLLCVVDDAQWLDRPTTQALAFVARRLGADSVGIVIASREVVEGLDGVPELELAGLDSADARALLDSVLVGLLDGAVRERFLAETSGNPLALLELPRTLTLSEAATGIISRTGTSLSARLEQSFVQRLEPLPEDCRRFLLLAAAEPLGDPLLLLRAASQVGLGAEAADPAADAGLVEIGERVSFLHPLVRSAIYRAAPQRERRLAHGALADATDAETDPDRKAWHRALATAIPDESVAAELEETASRAKARGGLAAAGAFLERATMLTPLAAKRAERALAAAEVLYEAGSLDAAERLLRAVENRGSDELQSARAERLRAQVVISLGDEEPPSILRLLTAADRLVRVDPTMGQRAQLEALRMSFFLGRPDVLQAVVAALDHAPASGTSPLELMVRGWAQLLGQGYPAGTDLLRQAMVALREEPQLEEADLPVLHYAEGISRSLWDFDSWEALAERMVQLARDSGALLQLPRALGWWANVKAAAGDLPAAAAALAEAQAVGEAVGLITDWDLCRYAAYRFAEAEALAAIEQAERDHSPDAPALAQARAVVFNAAGRYEAALEAAQLSCDLHPVGTYSTALLELIEAAARCDQVERGRAALAPLVERTRLGGTDWALGLEARSTALVSDDADVAEPLYQEALERLERARTRVDLARAHLVYGEWLRREGRRLDSREQLRTAHDLFAEIGAPVFAERARRELAATGETARKRVDETRADLTAQEAQIARFAAEGLTNPEIGAQLFLSPRTVEWHLRRVYPKLGITSRKELRTVLH
jgi:DNA-binding CsgD family transcriptional regulator